MESEDITNDVEQQPTSSTSQNIQTQQSERTKIQELITLVKDMHDQNSSGQLSSELCMQIFVIIEELTPSFNEKLKVDMGKCLEKIRKALRKDKFESKDQDSSKSKGSFKTLFKSSKNGLCYEAIEGYVTVLLTKAKEGHEDLWEELKVLSSAVIEQNNAKKPLKKEKSSKNKNSDPLDQSMSRETSVEEPVINQSSADNLESSLTSKSEANLAKQSINDDKSKKDDSCVENCNHLSNIQSKDKDDASIEVQVSTEDQSTEVEQLNVLSKQQESTPEPLLASTVLILTAEQIIVNDSTKKEDLSSIDDQKPTTEQLSDENKQLLSQKPMSEEQNSPETKEEQQTEVEEHTTLPEHTLTNPLATTDDKIENSKVEHESIIDKSLEVNESSEINQSLEVEQNSSKDKTLVKRKTSFRDKFFKKKQPSLNKQLSIDEQECNDINPTLDTQVSLEKQNSTEEQPGDTTGNQSDEFTKKLADKKSKKAEKSSKKDKKSSKKETTVEEQDQPSGNDSSSTDQTSNQKKSIFKKQPSKEDQLKLPELITNEDAVPKIQELIQLITDMFEQNTSGQINPELCSQIYALIEELTPFFNDRLNIDLDKHLSKMKKALKKVNVDVVLKETSIFQTFFKFTKSGLFFRATMLYLRTLISKFNDNPGELSDVLSPLSDILSLEDKKGLEKEQAVEDDKKSLVKDDSEDKQASKASDSKKEQFLVEGQSANSEDNYNKDQSLTEEQTTGPESLTNEEAMSKIKELINLATEMFEQNKSAQIEPELCTQMYAILHDLTPYFAEKLNIDLEKYLSKMKKSLKKDIFELDLPDSSKRKQIFTAIFKYTKSGLFFGTATLYIRKLIAKAEETPGELSDALKPLSEIVSVENVADSIKSRKKEVSGEIGEGERKKEVSEDENKIKKTKTSKTANRSKSAKNLEKAKIKDEQMDVELPKTFLNLITPNKSTKDSEVTPNEDNDHKSGTQKCYNEIEGTESNKVLDNRDLAEADNDEGSTIHQSGLKLDQDDELKIENAEGDQPSVDEETSKDNEGTIAIQEESGPKEDDNDNKDNNTNNTKLIVDASEDIKQDSDVIEASANENNDINSEEEQPSDKIEELEFTDQNKSNQKEQSDDEDPDSTLILNQITPKLSKFKQMFTKPKQQQQPKPKKQIKKSTNEEKESKLEVAQKCCSLTEGSEGNKSQDNPEASEGVNRFGDTINFNDDELKEEDNDEGSIGLGAHRSGLDPERNEESTVKDEEQSEVEDEEGSSVDEEESDTEDDEEDDSDSDDDSDEEFDSDMEDLLDDYDSDDDDEEGKGHKVMSVLLKIAKKALNVALDLDI